MTYHLTVIEERWNEEALALGQTDDIEEVIDEGGFTLEQILHTLSGLAGWSWSDTWPTERSWLVGAAEQDPRTGDTICYTASVSRDTAAGGLTHEDTESLTKGLNIGH